jgi:hypothetical protein
MNRTAHILGALALVTLSLGGCATMHGQPKMNQAEIMPKDLKPGDTAVITVKVEDKFHVVRRVEGVVKEDRTLTFHFEDNGVAPDDKAGDGIWTIQVDVPFNAPPGDFEFEVSGFDSNGKLLAVDDKRGEAQPLTTSFTLAIQYPADAAAANAPAAKSQPAPAPKSAAPAQP